MSWGVAGQNVELRNVLMHDRLFLQRNVQQVDAQVLAQSHVHEHTNMCILWGFINFGYNVKSGS